MGAELPAVIGLSGLSALMCYLAVNIPEKYRPISILLLVVGIITSFPVLEIVIDETGISLLQTMYADSIWLLRAILFIAFIDFLWKILQLWLGRRIPKTFSEEMAADE